MADLHFIKVVPEVAPEHPPLPVSVDGQPEALPVLLTESSPLLTGVRPGPGPLLLVSPGVSHPHEQSAVPQSQHLRDGVGVAHHKAVRLLGLELVRVSSDGAAEQGGLAVAGQQRLGQSLQLGSTEVPQEKCLRSSASEVHHGVTGLPGLEVLQQEIRAESGAVMEDFLTS